MAIKLKVGTDANVKLNASGTNAASFDMRDAQVVAIDNYNDLANKPSINGVELVGDKTTSDLGIDVGVTSWNGQTGDVIYTPPQVPVQSVNGQTGAVVLDATDVGALPDNTPIPSKTSDLVNDSGFVTSSDIPTKVSELTNDAGFVNSAQAANAAPVQSVNGATGTVVLDANDVGALPDSTQFVGSVAVTPSLSSGTKVGTINVDGTPTDLYAPTNTDTKVTQTATTTSDYTYWRGLCVGASATQTESGALSNITDQVRVFNNIRVQPSTGTIKATAFKGDLTGDVTGTASGNLKSGDNISSLTNDEGYVDAAGAASASPVQSVNGDTGAVVLDATDVGALPDNTVYALGQSAGGNAVRANGILYAQVDNTSTSTKFTVTIPGVTEYYDGLAIMLKNGVVTSASGFTINVNGLGAKQAYNNMTAATAETTLFNINYTMLFVYDSTRVTGGGWIMYRGYDANTNTIGYQVRTNSYSLPMTSIVYRYRLLFQSADNAHWVPATNSTSTNATAARTVCQDPINPFGSIVYYGTTASVAAGNRPSAANLWQQYTFTLGYSFQKSPNYVLTEWKPVYLKCAPQSNGSAIIDDTTPFVQDLPTTEDGKIYIWLGVAYSTTAMELTIYHPVYYYKDGAIREWTNAGSGAPPVTSADNGKVLMVVNGAWAVASLPIYNGGVS